MMMQKSMIKEVIHLNLVAGAKRTQPEFKRLGLQPTFENIWRAKSAMCSGKEVNLQESFFEETVV
jgi:hypothetical protein